MSSSSFVISSIITYYWLEQGRERWKADELSDISAVRQDLISVSPLQTDTTHHDTLATFRTWDELLDGRAGP